MKTIQLVPVVILLLAGCSKSENNPASISAPIPPAEPAPTVRAASVVAASPRAAANPDPVVSAPTSTIAQKTPVALVTPAGSVQVAANPTATATAAFTPDQAPVAPPPIPDSANAHPVISAPANSALEKAAGALSATVDGSTNANRILGRVMGALTNFTGSNSPAVVRTSAPASNPSSVASSVSAANLPTDLIARGLKEALAGGLDKAIANLGKEGGFLTNLNVRIPMPEKLQAIEKLLRRTGQNQLADEFVTTMNRAAEKAVPAAASVFGDSLKQMTVEDARGILQGPKDAATQYFRRTAGPQLQEKFRPIVAQATSEAGVTATYKKLLDRASFASAFLKQEALDLDDYVTTKAMDGLFKTVAEEEKRIRENPVARTTDLLKSVFGALGR